MPGSEIYTDAERREHHAMWVADEAEARMERLLAKRPAKFDRSGSLHPDLAAWSARFLAGDIANVKIIGNVGSGKSWNLWRLALHLVHHGFLGRIEIIPAHKLKRLITPPVDLDALDKLAAADLLALDDVAAIRVSDWDADHLYGLFDDRWAADKPTIVASNLPVLGEVLGDRAASRLGDNLITVKITGPDRRGQR